MMDEFEQMQLDNFLGVYNIGSFDAALRTGYKYLEEAKQLYADYVKNGGEFPEDNLNDMKKYALDNFERANRIVKGDIKHLPAACKKSTAYRKARAAYTAAVEELLAAIEAFEVEIEVEVAVEETASVEAIADKVLVEVNDTVVGVTKGERDKSNVTFMVQELLEWADELGLPELKHVSQHLWRFYNSTEIGPAVVAETINLRRQYLDRLAATNNSKVEISEESATDDNESGWVDAEPTEAELQKASDDADVDGGYAAAMEIIESELARLDDELFEYEYGVRQEDEDAYEREYQLKADIRYIRAARTAIEDALYNYNRGIINALAATDIMYAKSNQF